VDWRAIVYARLGCDRDRGARLRLRVAIAMMRETAWWLALLGGGWFCVHRDGNAAKNPQNDARSRKKSAMRSSNSLRVCASKS
jgi:hypothetical protein